MTKGLSERGLVSVNPESAPEDAEKYLYGTDEAQEAKDNRSHGRCAESPNATRSHAGPQKLD